jgi:hypothetical protein
MLEIRACILSRQAMRVVAVTLHLAPSSVISGHGESFFAELVSLRACAVAALQGLWRLARRHTSTAAERSIRDLTMRHTTLNERAYAEIARRSPPLLEVLYKWATNPEKPTKRRFVDLKAILKEALEARQLELGERVLGDLEAMVKFGHKLVLILERRGDNAKAAELLKNEFHRSISQSYFGHSHSRSCRRLRISPLSQSYGMKFIQKFRVYP